MLKNLQLTDFRNYRKTAVTFDPRLTLVIGPNGVGKSNLLEAVYLLASGRSVDAVVDADLVRNGSAAAHLQAKVVSNGEEVEFGITVRRGEAGRSQKIFRVNRVRRPRRQFLGRLPAVLFTPRDISLVLGSPSRRRSYLDTVLAAVSDDYREAFGVYQRVLPRRNKLLEAIAEGRSEPAELDYWNEKLLVSGEVLQRERQAFFDFIAKVIPPISRKLINHGGYQQFQFVYQPVLLTKKKLAEGREREIAARASLWGPHRDDFDFVFDLGGQFRSLKPLGSRGQQRTAVLALKLGELKFVEERAGSPPTLLLDDIFSELDTAHRQAVGEVIANYQTAITAVEGKLVPTEIIKEATRIDLG